MLRSAEVYGSRSADLCVSLRIFFSGKKKSGLACTLFECISAEKYRRFYAEKRRGVWQPLSGSLR